MKLFVQYICQKIKIFLRYLLFLSIPSSSNFNPSHYETKVSYKKKTKTNKQAIEREEKRVLWNFDQHDVKLLIYEVPIKEECKKQNSKLTENQKIYRYSYC